jgi:formamidopyrimidine-DNA glycosylase
MPELPDLQAFSGNLNKKLAGKKLKQVQVNSSNLNVEESELKKSIEGEKVKEIYREGKELRIKFDNEHVLGLHLMLNGELHFFEEQNTHPYTIVEFLFDDGTGLALTDFQERAKPALNPEESKAPDALSKEANVDYLKQKLAKTKTSIKKLLLDQKIIRGIGNAYGDEILWDARISPFSLSNKIPEDKIKVLCDSIRSVLEDAEKQILKAKPDIITGEVRDFLKVHNHRKKQSPTGADIKVDTINGRKTYYTDEQELYK